MKEEAAKWAEDLKLQARIIIIKSISAQPFFPALSINSGDVQLQSENICTADITMGNLQIDLLIREVAVVLKLTSRELKKDIFV